jgi:hypothetical protein
MTRKPSGLRDISTTYQLAYETYDGKVQVRKIGSRLWEILARGGATLYEKSKPEALERAFQLAAVGSAPSRKGASKKAPQRKAARKGHRKAKR